MSDSTTLPNIPGADALANSMSAATKSFQGFAEEMQKISKDSIDQTNQVMEKLRGAKTFEEVVSIQTSYLQQSFATYAESSRRFGELMMALPMELAKQGRAAFQDGADAGKKAGEHAAESFKQHQG